MAKRKTTTATTCQQISGLLLDYVNGALASPVKRRFDQHLEICPDCVSFLKTYRKTIAATQEVPVESMPEKTRDNLLTFLRQRLRKLSVWISFLALSAGA